MLVTDTLLAFTLAAALLTLTPGLDTALVLRTATVECLVLIYVDTYFTHHRLMMYVIGRLIF
ncbi:lysine transporter LysE [Xenorhabdus beddingii]|uniref:Lysine transporter LysE n=1 Tax=Xenorhabdus beddingii TaxID=40578 RepID=A0A1Y2SPB1_9GAMM|nr:lysine transporter LysE [Xenorhabdus beddingii]